MRLTCAYKQKRIKIFNNIIILEIDKIGTIVIKN